MPIFSEEYRQWWNVENLSTCAFQSKRSLQYSQICSRNFKSTPYPQFAPGISSAHRVRRNRSRRSSTSVCEKGMRKGSMPIFTDEFALPRFPFQTRQTNLTQFPPAQYSSSL